MEENRIFAFDIDGTLLGYNAEVKRNMDKLFQAIFKKYKNPQIMFVSGGDTLKVDRSVKIMEKVAGVDLSSAIQVSHSGGYIRGENNKTYREDFFFKPDLVQKIINEIFSVDKYFYVVFCTSEGCFFPNYLLNDPTGDWLSVEVTKDIMYKVGNGFVADVASNEQIRALVNENKIRSILALFIPPYIFGFEHSNPEQCPIQHHPYSFPKFLQSDLNKQLSPVYLNSKPLYSFHLL